jgi:hypothetical protein
MFEHGELRKVDKSRPYALVVMKGGAGSGHHGHKGIPGHQGGSLPAGAASKKVAEVRMMNTEDIDPKNQARLKAELEAFADELGFPKDKLIFDDSDGEDFIVGGEKYEQAAKFDPKTGEITMYAGSMTGIDNDNLHFQRELIAHEVMHNRFREFERQLHRQEATINKLSVGFDDNPVLDDNYNLKPEFREQYWAVDIKQRYYQDPKIRELLYQIPVTDYGKSYIDVAKKSPYGVDVSKALSENLAEVAAFGNSSNSVVSTRWSNFYNEINQSMYAHKLISKYAPLVRSNT